MILPTERNNNNINKIKKEKSTTFPRLNAVDGAELLKLHLAIRKVVYSNLEDINSYIQHKRG